MAWKSGNSCISASSPARLRSRRLLVRIQSWISTRLGNTAFSAPNPCSCGGFVFPSGDQSSVCLFPGSEAANLLGRQCPVEDGGAADEPAIVGVVQVEDLRPKNEGRRCLRRRLHLLGRALAHELAVHVEADL